MTMKICFVTFLETLAYLATPALSQRCPIKLQLGASHKSSVNAISQLVGRLISSSFDHICWLKHHKCEDLQP